VISQVSRVYTGLDSIGGRKIEISAKIGPLGWDQEVVSRFVTNIANNNIFYTDNNGLELQERINLPDGRPGDHDDGVRIGGNYYPAVSRAIIQNTNNNVQLAVVTQSTQGAASLSNGQLEIMLHRFSFLFFSSSFFFLFFSYFFLFSFSSINFLGFKNPINSLMYI